MQGIGQQQKGGGLATVVLLETQADLMSQMRVEQGVGYQPENIVTKVLDAGAGGNAGRSHHIGQHA